MLLALWKSAENGKVRDHMFDLFTAPLLLHMHMQWVITLFTPSSASAHWPMSWSDAGGGNFRSQDFLNSNLALCWSGRQSDVDKMCEETFIRFIQHYICRCGVFLSLNQQFGKYAQIWVFTFFFEQHTNEKIRSLFHFFFGIKLWCVASLSLIYSKNVSSVPDQHVYIKTSAISVSARSYLGLYCSLRQQTSPSQKK